MLKYLIQRLSCSYVIAAPLLLVGCTSFDREEAKPISATNHRDARRKASLAEFERRRVEAQYLGAQERWNVGDFQGCERQLRKMLERRPLTRNGRVLLANVLIMQDRAEEAELLLNEQLSMYPDDAEAHHDLAVLLETSGRPELAKTHFYQASQIEPHNPHYRSMLY